MSLKSLYGWGELQWGDCQYPHGVQECKDIALIQRSETPHYPLSCLSTLVKLVASGTQSDRHTQHPTALNTHGPKPYEPGNQQKDDSIYLFQIYQLPNLHLYIYLVSGTSCKRG